MVSPLVASRPGSLSIKFADQEEPVRINDFIWMSEGSSNTYLIQTRDGDILVNSGLGVEASVHRRCFQLASQSPIRYLLLTQGHVDHVGGIDLFKQDHPDMQVVAQANIFTCQEDDQRIQGFRYRRNVRFYPEFLKPVDAKTDFEHDSGLEQGQRQSVASPDVLFDRRHSIELGGLQIELISVPGGETTDSTLIWLPQHRVLFSGNTLGPLFPHFPNFYTIRGDKLRFALPYLDAIQTMIDLEPELLITGHFDPIAGAELLQTELCRLRDAVRYVHDKTVAGMNTGKDVFSLMDEIQLPPELEVGQEYGTVPWGVRAIYEGYAGWFQFRSTTELYSRQPASLYAEIATLAGADNLAARALELIDDGEVLAAIHLCEMALAGKSQPVLAWQVYLRAHEQLLAECHQRNRWQVYWLKGEINRARQALEEQ